MALHESLATEVGEGWADGIISHNPEQARAAWADVLDSLGRYLG